MFFFFVFNLVQPPCKGSNPLNSIINEAKLNALNLGSIRLYMLDSLGLEQAKFELEIYDHLINKLSSITTKLNSTRLVCTLHWIFGCTLNMQPINLE